MRVLSRVCTECQHPENAEKFTRFATKAQLIAHECGDLRCSTLFLLPQSAASLCLCLKGSEEGKEERSLVVSVQPWNLIFQQSFSERTGLALGLEYLLHTSVNA